MKKRVNLIAIVGPTATGKTSLAFKLANRLNRRSCAIISRSDRSTTYKACQRFSTSDGVGPLNSRPGPRFSYPLAALILWFGAQGSENDVDRTV